MAGPLPVEDDVAYIPQPVDTSMVSELYKFIKLSLYPAAADI